MIKLRILNFFFLFCVFHKCEILDAASAKREINKICQTPACKDAASTILQSIDPKVAPCDDFYKFACGNFLKTTVIPKDDIETDRYDSLGTKVREQLTCSLEEPVQPNEPRWITLTKNFYKACMNTTAIEKVGLRTVLGNFKKIGGWPVLEGDSWKEKNFDWKQLTYDMRKLGYYPWCFFDFNVVTDPVNNKKRVLNIDQPRLYPDRALLVKGLNDKKVTAYYNYMIDMALGFGANKTGAEKELKETLDFEIKLANITVSQQNRVNETALSNPMTVKELSGNYSYIPWKEYFNSVLKSIIVIDDDEVILVEVPTFFEQFGKLLKETPKRVLANYLFWKAAQNKFGYLTEEIRSRDMKFNAVLSGLTKSLDRSQECQEISAMLRLSNGALYARKYLNPESKRSAEELLVNIKQQMQEILKEVDWMDEKTRTSALDKLKFMKNLVGYPDELLDDKALDEYYKTLEITPNDYLQAILNITIFTTDSSFSQLRKPVNQSDWKLRDDITDVNNGVSYSPLGNNIDLSAGSLQGIFFNNDRPQYLNYGGIGPFDLGPHITVAFGNKCRQFDKNGNLKDWWTPETNTKYLQKAACFIQQYGNYTVEEVGLKVNGSLTQESNIADNGGLKISYLAYQDLVKRNGPEPKLPGLKYSQSQLFWIQAAVTQCSKFNPEELKNVIFMRETSPADLKVKGAFANRPEFAKDFNCPLGSKMNPVKKCSVW